jgi:hypothetical protein
MTVLAKMGNLAGKELGVVTSVGGVTDQAVLFDRGMLPHVRTSLFSVALVTQIIDRIRLDHFGTKSAVMVVAIRTFHFSFTNWMVGLLALLCPYRAVAYIAEVGLTGFQIFWCSRVNRVAIVAGDIRDFMLA